MPGKRQVALHAHPSPVVQRHAQRAGQRGGFDARGPEHILRGDAIVAHPDGAVLDVRHEGAEHHVDADRLQVGQRAVAELGGHASQQTRRTLDENHPRRRGVDVPEVAWNRLGRDLLDGTGQLHAGGPSTDHDEGQLRASGRLVSLDLRRFECEEHAAPDLDGIIDRLEPGGIVGPPIVAEVRVCRPGGQDQVVVGKDGVSHLDLPAFKVHPIHVAEDDLHVLLPAHDAPDRGCDVRRRERGRGHLVEQRLEQVVILAVDQHDAKGRTAETARYFETTESSTHDDDHRVPGVGGQRGRRHVRGRDATGGRCSRCPGGSRRSSCDPGRIPCSPWRKPIRTRTRSLRRSTNTQSSCPTRQPAEPSSARLPNASCRSPSRRPPRRGTCYRLPGGRS